MNDNEINELIEKIRAQAHAVIDAALADANRDGLAMTMQGATRPDQVALALDGNVGATLMEAYYRHVATMTEKYADEVTDQRTRDLMRQAGMH